MKLKAKPTTREVYIDDSMSGYSVIGKLAWNDHHKIGGIIEAIDDRSVTISGSVHYTSTGDCPYDSLTINGFKVYECK